MRALIQRVKKGKVTVKGEVIGEIGQGILLFLGIHRGDDEGKIPWLAEKVVNLRIFEDEGGKMNRSLIDVGGRIACGFPVYVVWGLYAGKTPLFY